MIRVPSGPVPASPENLPKRVWICTCGGKMELYEMFGGIHVRLGEHLCDPSVCGAGGKCDGPLVADLKWERGGGA